MRGFWVHCWIIFGLSFLICGVVGKLCFCRQMGWMGFMVILAGEMRITRPGSVCFSLAFNGLFLNFGYDFYRLGWVYAFHWEQDLRMFVC